MPANTPFELQTDVLRQALTDQGVTGITIDSTIYPDTSDALMVFKDFAGAIQLAQQRQNAATNPGERVTTFNRVTGANAQVEDPPNSGTFLPIRPVVFTAGYNEVVTVSDVVPNRG